MNVNKKIVSALDSLKIPIFTDVCEENLDEYIVFNYSDEDPDAFSDDYPEYDIVSLQVHYYLRGRNPHTARDKIGKLLYNAGFDVTLGPILYEADTNMRHCVIEIQADEPLDYESED